MVTDHPPWPDPRTETELVLDGTTHRTDTAPDGVPAVGDPAAEGPPVFVDLTGARHRRTRALLAVASLLCLGFVGLVVLGLTASGPLSSSPILTPVRGALDNLGVPRSTSSATVAGGPASPSVSSPAADASTTTGPAQTTSGGAAVPRPSTTPTTRPTSARPTPTTAAPSASPTPSNPGATRRATPTPSAGSTHRATPTPKASRTP
jgi:hypothetical protein